MSKEEKKGEGELFCEDEVTGRMDSNALARRIFEVEAPEKFIQNLPAQSFYMAVQSVGVESAGDLLALATPEQYRMVLDLELWNRDEFSEENFWHWIQSVDQELSLEPLLRFANSVDRSLLALILARYVDYIVLEEPTETPPDIKYYSPDKGYTWVGIHIEDKEKHRALGRVLAFLFQTQPELFYQLLFSSKGATALELEEQSYERKTKRLLNERIPDFEIAARIHARLNPESVRGELECRTKKDVLFAEAGVVHPLVYEGRLASLLQSLFSISSSEQRLVMEGEVTLIANAALVYFSVPFYEFEEVRILLKKVKGAINIGLARAAEIVQQEVQVIYEVLGLQRIYQIGLFEIHQLKKRVLKLSDLELSGALEAPARVIVEAAREDFPSLPAFFAEDGTIRAHEGVVSPELKAFETLAELRAVMKYVETTFPLS